MNAGVYALPISPMKIHLSRARELKAASPDMASAETARARLLASRTAGKNHAQKVAKGFEELKQRLKAFSMPVLVESDEETKICALWKTEGCSEGLLSQARALLKIKDSPRLHRFLLENDLEAGRLAQALFHLDRAGLSWSEWLPFWVNLSGKRIWAVSALDWIKFGLWVFLVVLIFQQGLGLIRDRKQQANRAGSQAKCA